MIVQLDLELLKESKLHLDEFFILTLLNMGEDIVHHFQFYGSTPIQALERNLWTKRLEDGTYVLRSKGKNLFKPKIRINFDEFWDAFPTATPSGRVLRASSKTWGNKPTRDYEVCQRKYLSKIKSIEAHNQAISIVKARVASGDYEYMNNLETYINQEKWQQDAKYLGQVNTTNTINKIVE